MMSGIRSILRRVVQCYVRAVAKSASQWASSKSIEQLQAQRDNGFAPMQESSIICISNMLAANLQAEESMQIHWKRTVSAS